MAAMSEAEDLLVSCIMNSTYSPPYTCPHMSQGEQGKGKAPRWRRRRKARGDCEGSSLEAKKRRLTDEQARLLEISFNKERKLESGRKVQLAVEVGLDPKQVAVWFQNRRSRWKSKKLEEELVHLKSAHDQANLDKCELEKEVLILKEKLSIAEEDMKKITTSTFCTGTYQSLLGEFEVEGGVPQLLYLNDYSSMMD